MFDPLTPARRLASAIESRGIEAQTIGLLASVAHDVMDNLDARDPQTLRTTERVCALLSAIVAMTADLAEELEKLGGRAYDLQEAPPTSAAPHTPAAA